MTIIDTDIISVTPILDDKKSLGLDMSETLFDYDLLLDDVTDARNMNNATPLKQCDSLFESLFHNDNDEISDNSSNASSPNKKRPRIMQWGPQDGHESSTIVSVVLEHTEETGPMKIVFGSMTVETAQQQHRLSSTSENDHSVWITLAASVPSLTDTRSESNQIQISVCAFDPLDPDLAIDTWVIGKFTYRDIPEEIHANYFKRALSNEPDDGHSKKKTTFDMKHQDGDVDSQLLKLLAPYDPLLTVSSSGESPHSNLVSTPQSTAASWMSSPMDDNPQHIFSQVNTTPSNNINTPYPATNIMLQHGLVNGRSSSNNPFDINHHQYMATMATKQEMFRNYAELQQRQRQGVPFTLQQQQQQQQQKQQHNLVAQAMNNYMHTNYTNHFDSANTSDCYTDHGNHILYNMAEQEKQNQQFQRLQQQQQQLLLQQRHMQQQQQHHHQQQQNQPRQHQPQQQQQAQQPQQQQIAQYNLAPPKRSTAPVSSYSITNSNSCALNKAHLKLNGDLMSMIINWSIPEWQSGRRLVRFWRHSNNGADGNLSLVECGFEPMDQQVYHQQRMRDNVAAVAAAAAAAVAVSNSSPSISMNNTTNRPTPIVISCIYWRERNDYFITSVDCIYLLESLIGIQFTVEEKNRIRRNLEGFRPLTVSKCKIECADFFKLIMSFPHPKPRNIEKDVKVFAWKTLPHALRKIIRKYTPSYITSAPLEPIQQHSNQNRSNNNNNHVGYSSSSHIF